MFVGPVGIEPPWFASLTQGLNVISTHPPNKQQNPRSKTEDFLVVGPVGIEPTTHGLKVRCSNQLS